TSAIASEVMPVILCHDIQHQAEIAAMLKGRCRLAPSYLVAAYDDTWFRDYGPICVAANGKPKLLDFTFTGWGNKYDASLDDAVNQSLKAIWQADLHSVALELEGGSIETDGKGTLLSTVQCLLSGKRNARYSPSELEQVLLKNLGLSRTLWLHEGILVGDDTDSHIDNLARFCSADTIVYSICSNPNDPHYVPLQAMAKELHQFRQISGAPYQLHGIEIPSPRIDEQGRRLPGSYVNFLILNNSIIMPVFDCPQDAAAIATLKRCFADKRILTVPGNNLIRQFGGPHCATMQLPEGCINQQVTKHD
ncbi:MAG: agmatine deiminase family protein, partial [Pseudohongiellaceae bacterium]